MKGEKEEIAWASIFPQMDAHPTQDPRIFQTTWEKQATTTYPIKKKTYFCCVSEKEGNNCYGIEVIRQWAVDATKECHSAFAKVKAAAYYFEEHGVWPKED